MGIQHSANYSDKASTLAASVLGGNISDKF